MTVTLNGRQLTLHFSVNAVCEMERTLKVSLYDLLKSDVSSVRALLWCGLMEAAAPFTLKETGEMLDRHLKSGGSLLELSESLAGALEEAGFFH